MVASIGCSLFWVGFAVSKPLSQIHRSTLLPLQDTDSTPSFGGLGLNDPDNLPDDDECWQPSLSQSRKICNLMQAIVLEAILW